MLECIWNHLPDRIKANNDVKYLTKELKLLLLQYSYAKRNCRNFSIENLITGGLMNCDIYVSFFTCKNVSDKKNENLIFFYCTS